MDNLSSFLHTIKSFQVLLYHCHNLTSVICLHKVCSIWLIDRTLSGATTLGQSGPGSDDKEEVLCIPQCSSITGTSPSDCLVTYPRHSLRESYHSVVLQLVWSTALDDQLIFSVDNKLFQFRVFLFLDWLQYQDERIQAALLFTGELLFLYLC